MMELLKKYDFNNAKPTYYRLKLNDGIVDIEYIEPSFVYELAYIYSLNNEDEYIKSLELELSNVIKEKEIKINRRSSMDTKKLQERVFRSLVNRTKAQTLELCNELMLRDVNLLLDILYPLSLVAEDENKLIKTYLFEILTKEVGYNPYILKNLVGYFLSSCNKYQKEQIKKSTKLYKHIYKLKTNKEHNSEDEKMSLSKELIYKYLIRR